MPTSPSLYDVIIAGAGPVGLFLACELRLAGVSVLVLEQASSPSSPLKERPFGLRGLSMPGTEAFYRRGMLDDLIARQPSPDDAGRIGGAPHWMQQARRAGGHFAGIQFFLDKVNDTAWPYRLASPAGPQLPTDMAAIEAVLTGRALASGVHLRRGAGVSSLSQVAHGATVHADGQRFEAGWLVGCDGGRSTVRKAAGIAFTGTEPAITGYSMDVELADPHALPPGRHYTPTGMFTFTPPGTITMADFDGGAWHRSATITREHAQAVLRLLSGTEVTLSSLGLVSTWTDRAYQAETYRRGRVLLAGDAAHVHSPLGGQGLNLGLGDAMNLGWKLAATVRGDAPDGLLDTYTAERHPVGARVLEWSRAQVALMRPDAGSRAMANVVRDLMETVDGATYFADRIWGASLRYDLGGEHPLVGMSVPDFELADGTRVGELLRSGKGLLLDFGAGGGLAEVVGERANRVAYIACGGNAPPELAAVLVRPDGIVAWVATRDGGIQGIDEAIGRWFP